MSTKSAIDQFAAAIVARLSLYLTACLGLLLIATACLRQLTLDPAATLSPLAEIPVLCATLVFTYVAIRCAGILAIASAKTQLLQSNRMPGHAAPTYQGATLVVPDRAETTSNAAN